MLACAKIGIKPKNLNSNNINVNLGLKTLSPEKRNELIDRIIKEREILISNENIKVKNNFFLF